MNDTWLLILVGGLILLWGVSLIGVRQWTKRRLLKTLAQEGLKVEDLAFQLPDPRPEDQAALEIIRAYRRRYLLKLWPDTEFSFKLANDLALELIQAIAKIYYPDEARPEFKASLADLVRLYNRVGMRLQSWLESLPVRPFKDLELQTVLRYHELYQKFKNHPGYLFLKRHHLDKIARWAWIAKNYANPWYWGRRAAYAGSKEFLARLFLARVAAIVGEEALRLYSQRLPGSRWWSRYQAAVQEMINLARENGTYPPEAATHILKFILQARSLEDQEKLALLHYLAQPQAQSTPALEKLDRSDRIQIQRWLIKFATACWSGAEREQRLARVQARWGP